jgi:two-component system chemotaxis response regulator CheY
MRRIPSDPRFLVVDDYPAMRRVVRAVLAELGWRRVAEAADGVAALSLLRGMPFDVVITDIHMPRLNGFELLDSIKADPALRHLPVLMASAEARREDVELAARRGAIGCIVKPFSAATLAERLEPVLGTAAIGDRARAGGAAPGGSAPARDAGEDARPKPPDPRS